VLLIVVEDFPHTLHARVVLSTVFFLRCSLVPIENSTNEWGDEERTGFCGCDGLCLRKEKCEIAIDAVLG